MPTLDDPATTDLTPLLQRHWGYDGLRPFQDEAIAAALAKRDALVILPTGGGKSMCYQLPALARPGLTVVVSPLLALIKDQVDGLLAMGIPAAALTSQHSGEERRATRAAAREGKLKLLYVAPEGLIGADGAPNEGLLELLADTELQGFAVDEAHCISQWGHEYRPSYRQLGKLRQHFPQAPIQAFTATATEAVRDDIEKNLGLREPARIVGRFDRPNLIYRALPRVDELAQVRQVIDSHKGAAGIVYCIRKKDVDQLTGKLAMNGYKVVAYHADLAPEVRRANQEAFSNEEVDLVVATVAFGMGIDRSDVRFVLHTGLPKSLEAYQQEAGRAGRDGLPADCVLLHGAGDAMTWRRLQDDLHGPAADAAWARLAAMEGYARAVSCRHKLLSEYFGQAYDEPGCGACDVCLGELALVESPRAIAEAILQGVRATGQRFGGGHVADVLKGSQGERVKKFRHDELEAHGSLSKHARPDIADWIGQLVSQGLLVRGDHEVIKLTPEGEAFLAGAGEVALTAARPAKKAAPRTSGGEAVQLSDAESALFDDVRGWRRSLAQARGIPPYVIMHDATVVDMVRKRPGSLAALAAVKGLGERRAADFGADLLAFLTERYAAHGLVGDASAPPPRPALPTKAADAGEQAERVEKAEKAEKGGRPQAGDSQRKTMEMFLDGQAPADIAAARSLQLTTVLGHLAPLIDEGSVGVEDVLDDDVAAPILAAAAWLGEDLAPTPLSYVLPADTLSGAIQCVIAAASHGGLPTPDPEAAERRRKMFAAIEAPDAKTAGRLFATLRTAEPGLRALAAYGLGRVAPTAAAPGLVEAYAQADDPVVQQAILRALGACGDPAGLPLAEAVAADPAADPAMRMLGARVAKRLAGSPSS